MLLLLVKMESMNWTNLEQSKKLLELGVNPQSADMGICVCVDESERYLPIDDWALHKNGEYGTKFYPSWSVGALIDLMPQEIYSLTNYRLSLTKEGIEYVNPNRLGVFFCFYEVKTTLLDACFKMVVWLIENKYIKVK